jgi:hypothetical protein
MATMRQLVAFLKQKIMALPDIEFENEKVIESDKHDELP